MTKFHIVATRSASSILGYSRGFIHHSDGEPVDYKVREAADKEVARLNANTSSPNVSYEVEESE